MNLDERIEDCCINPPKEAEGRIRKLLKEVLEYVKAPMWEEAERNEYGNEIAWAIRKGEAKEKELGL